MSNVWGGGSGFAICGGLGVVAMGMLLCGLDSAW
jgi:hypothetical protein